MEEKQTACQVLRQGEREMKRTTNTTNSSSLSRLSSSAALVSFPLHRTSEQRRLSEKERWSVRFCAPEKVNAGVALGWKRTDAWANMRERDSDSGEKQPLLLANTRGTGAER